MKEAWEKQYDELNDIPEGMEDFYRHKAIQHSHPEAQAEIARLTAERDALAAELAKRGEPVASGYRFDRYINGQLMAEGIRIERETTLAAAMRTAAKIASKGPNGEAPVLVYTHPAPASAGVTVKPLVDAAQSVVDRWDSPMWGGSSLNLRHTGEHIAALRSALAALSPTAEQGEGAV